MSSSSCEPIVFQQTQITCEDNVMNIYNKYISIIKGDWVLYSTAGCCACSSSSEMAFAMFSNLEKIDKKEEYSDLVLLLKSEEYTITIPLTKKEHIWAGDTFFKNKHTKFIFNNKLELIIDDVIFTSDTVSENPFEWESTVTLNNTKFIGIILG